MESFVVDINELAPQVKCYRNRVSARPSWRECIRYSWRLNAMQDAGSHVPYDAHS